MKDFHTFFSSLLFPPRCIGCDQWLDRGVPLQICATCHSQLNFLKVPGHFPHLKKKYFDAAHSIVAYEGLALDWVHRYKYFRQFFVGRELGRLLFTAALSWKEYDFLIPIPTHWRRQIWRGFNPGHLLAHFLSRRIFKPVAHTLKKKRPTPPQAKLSRVERLQNICGAFICRWPLGEKTILLMDDVITTGATANECAKVLKQAGAKRVDVLTLARTL